MRAKLLSRKVAADLSLVYHGGWVSDAVVDFSNEWWNFRYGLKHSNGTRIFGPTVVRQICSQGVQDGFVEEMKQIGAVIFDVNSAYFTGEDRPNEAQWYQCFSL